MPVLKLTKRSVDGLAPIEKPFIAFDADLPGFGVRVMPSGSKSWVAEYRPNGGGRGVAKKRVTIGKCGSLTADQARRAAGEILAKVRLSVVRWFGTYLIFWGGGSGSSDCWLNYAAFS